MGKMSSASSPDEYVAGLSGWQRGCVENLRATVTAAGEVEEAVKWGHLVYTSNGPVLLIRAEEQRVLFGFWRGQRLRHIEPALKSGGKYEMASLELKEGMSLRSSVARRLAKEAIRLNKALGDPRQAAKPTSKPKRKRRST